MDFLDRRSDGWSLYRFLFEGYFHSTWPHPHFGTFSLKDHCVQMRFQRPDLYCWRTELFNGYERSCLSPWCGREQDGSSHACPQFSMLLQQVL